MVSARNDVFDCLRLAVIGLAIASAALSAEEKVTVEVTPASIELREKPQVPVLVVVRNGTKQELGDVRLSWFTDAFVSIVPTPVSVETLPAGDATAWSLSVSRTGDEPVSGTVHFRVDYILSGPDAAPDSNRLALASVAVTSAGAISMADVATVEARTALVSLTEQRPGRLYLIVTNKLAVPITVQPFTPSGPEEFMKIDPGLETVIEPQQQRALTFEVRAEERVRPGKYLILFEVPLRWERGQNNYSGVIAVSHEVDIGVFGESAILKLLGLPSFLLLPGFLFVTTFGLLWRVKLFRAEIGGDFPLKPATADFWLVAISLSIISVFVYRKIIGHDYLQSYGLNDLVRLWGGAVVIGLLAYLITIIGIRRFQIARENFVARRTPAAADRPLEVLQKLERQKLGYELKTALVTITNQEQRAFLLQPFDESREMIWVGPIIEYDRKDSADPEIIEKVQRLLQPGAKTSGSLAEAFGQGRSHFELRWKSVGVLSGPQQVETAQVRLEAGRRIIVQAA